MAKIFRDLYQVHTMEQANQILRQRHHPVSSYAARFKWLVADTEWNVVAQISTSIRDCRVSLKMSWTW